MPDFIEIGAVSLRDWNLYLPHWNLRSITVLVFRVLGTWMSQFWNSERCSFIEYQPCCTIQSMISFCQGSNLCEVHIGFWICRWGSSGNGQFFTYLFLRMCCEICDGLCSSSFWIPTPGIFSVAIPRATWTWRGIAWCKRAVARCRSGWSTSAPTWRSCCSREDWRRHAWSTPPLLCRGRIPSPHSTGTSRLSTPPEHR